MHLSHFKFNFLKRIYTVIIFLKKSLKSANRISSDALDAARQEIQLEKFNTSNEKKNNLKQKAELETCRELMENWQKQRDAFKIRYEGV